LALCGNDNANSVIQAFTRGFMRYLHALFACHMRWHAMWNLSNG
jgi:hypothetical protein